MDVIAARRRLLEAANAELYPIGTDIVAKYIRDGDHWSYGYIIDSTGAFVQYGTGYASDVYMPVSPNYSYVKNGYRIGIEAGYAAWYDKDKILISTLRQNNLNSEPLPKPPGNAAYLRISTGNESNKSHLKIIRTA